MHEKIQRHFGKSYSGAAIEYSIEESPLGTGGALLIAAQKLDVKSPFLLLNGDTFFTVPLKSLRAFAAARDADWCLSLFRGTGDARYMGMDVSADGEIISFEPDNGLGQLANGGVYWVNPRSLADLGFSAGEKISLEKGIFPKAKAAGQRMFGVEFSGKFLDIGLPSDYYRAAEILGL